jgi:hypothetical protein
VKFDKQGKKDKWVHKLDRLCKIEFGKRYKGDKMIVKFGRCKFIDRENASLVNRTLKIGETKMSL